MKFIEQAGGHYNVYSGLCLIGSLNKGNSFGFFTDRKSFNALELIAIAEKLKELNK